MGSRILSRSFTVHKWKGTVDLDAAEEVDENGDDELSSTQDADASQASISSAGMEVDADAGLDAILNEVQGNQNPALDEESNSDDEEDSSDVAMVPVADMLNARYESENVSYSIAL
jgi:SET domain-containing protein 6